MSFLKNFINGLFIGIGAILPGISSGVICMVLGIYEKILDSILNFFKDIKSNFKYLFGICSGIIFSFICFSNILLYLFKFIPKQTSSLFIGLLLGSIFILYKNEIKNININNKLFSYISFFICFIIGIGLLYLENNLFISNENFYTEYSFLFLVLSGFFMSIGIVVPRSK